MSKEVYRQRFTASAPVVEALNELVQDPQDVFIFYAKKEFIPEEVPKEDDETGSARIHRIAKRIIDLGNHSTRLGAMNLQIGLPIDAIVHGAAHEEGRMLELDFSAFSPGGYWKIMQEFHRDDYPITPPRETLRELAEHSLALYLSFDNLRAPTEFNAGKRHLMQTLKSSATNYEMRIVKQVGVSDNQSSLSIVELNLNGDVVQ